MAHQYSDKTLNKLAQFVDCYYSHTEMDSLFFGASIPENFDSGQNKLQRILNVIKGLSTCDDPSYNSILEELFHEVITRHKNKFESESDNQNIFGFIRALKADGYEIKDGNIVPLDSLESELSEENNILYERLQYYLMNDVQNNLEQAHQNFINGNNEACNAMLRTALESTLERVAYNLSGDVDSIPKANNRYLTPADIRKYLEQINFFDNDEIAYIKAFYGYASTDGSHPGISNQAESRLRRLMIVALIQYSLEKLIFKTSQSTV